MACTHSARSCSSSQANTTRSPSRTALKNTRPPCRPAPPQNQINQSIGRRIQNFFFFFFNCSFEFCGLATWLRVAVVHRVAFQLHELLRFGLLLAVAAHGERVLAHLRARANDIQNCRLTRRGRSAPGHDRTHAHSEPFLPEPEQSTSFSSASTRDVPARTNS